MQRIRQDDLTLGKYAILVFCIAVQIFTSSRTVDGQSNGKEGASSDSTKLHEFEVASIKPIDPNVTHLVGVKVFPGGRVVLNGLSLKMLICVAFNVSYWQVAGGDDWAGKISYSVEAKPPDDTRARMFDLRYTLYGIEDENLRQMLQALLMDRFHLQFHYEPKPGQVYSLETSGRKLQLQETSAEGTAEHPIDIGGSIGFADRWVLHETTMPQLAKFASDYVLHRPVVDRTGLTGSYDYKSKSEDWSSYENDPTGSFLSLIHDVGLVLQSSKGQVETFVIDRADKPTPN
jgi:uncharacterized protein (TIGR03435 family)